MNPMMAKIMVVTAATLAVLSQMQAISKRMKAPKDVTLRASL